MKDRSPTPIRFPEIFAFASSGCLLVIELLAGRILAPSLGVSLYTWTGVIGTVLSGISLGNYVGGFIADRWPNRATLSLTLFLSSCLTTSILLLINHLETVSDLAPSTSSLPMTVLFVSFVLFFPVSLVLGTVTPQLVKLTLTSITRTGRVVGRIQAAAALGSIFGTLATGFVLIAWFGTRSILVGVALSLLLLSLVAAPRIEIPKLLALLVALGVLVVTTVRYKDVCTRETNYYCLRVETIGSFQVLYIDDLFHGSVDLEHPYRPHLEYEKLMLSNLPSPSRTLEMDALVLGGGAYMLPRYLAHEYDANVVVVEIDPEVTNVAHRYFGLTPDSNMQTINEDARVVLSNLTSTERFDVVIEDAFGKLSVPHQLATREFHTLVKAHLKESGVYLINLIDGPEQVLLGSFLKTLQSVFPNVQVQTEGGLAPSHGVSNFVIAASRTVLAPQETQLPVALMQAIVGRPSSVLLTDDYAPVDQMIWSPALR